MTLFSRNVCVGIDQLQVYDITDISSPVLISSRSLQNPKEIGLYGDYLFVCLFVCDNVIKILYVSDPTQMEFVGSINRSAFDLIIYQDKVHAIGDGELYQYSLNPVDIYQITPLSSITF